MKNNSGKVASGLFWTFGERILAQGISFVISIILARLLLPEEYGIISMVLVFINVANVFVSNGLGESLIQKKDATNDDYSTIFCCSFMLSVVLYLLLFFAAPWIAYFYSIDVLVPVIRVLALRLPLAAVNSIQHSYVSKHLQFKKFFFSTLGGTLISGLVGVILALSGFGIWALVIQYLLNSVVNTVILLFSVEWKPTFKFKYASAKFLMGFGLRMMLSSLINTVYSEMQTLVIGKVYTANDLAYYKRGNQFPSLFITNICTAVSTVLFPTMSNNTNSLEDVKSLTRKSMQLTAYVITPLMVGMIATAKPLVRLLLTDKWLPCVPYLQLLSLAYLFQPIQTANCQAIKAIGRSDVYLKTEILKKGIGVLLNCQAIKAIGRSDVYLKTEILKKGIGVLLLLFSLRRGTMAITIAFVITVMMSAVITMIPNIKLLHYSIKEQFMDLVPSFAFSLAVFVCVSPFSNLKAPNLIIIAVQVLVGVAIYVGLSVITKNPSLKYLVNRFKRI